MKLQGKTALVTGADSGIGRNLDAVDAEQAEDLGSDPPGSLSPGLIGKRRPTNRSGVACVPLAAVLRQARSTHAHADCYDRLLRAATCSTTQRRRSPTTAGSCDRRLNCSTSGVAT